MADQGTISMAEVVDNMTYNMGTPTFRGAGATGDESTTRINLRGLGPRATLQLLDGMRIVDDNVQTLLPMIAVQRLDVVVDGAAATYGTDAVAGVVNMIPYSSYDGVGIEYYQDSASGGFRDSQLSLIAGTSIGELDLVGAFSFRDTGNLEMGKRDYYTAGLRTNSLSNPASHRVPLRDENGLLTGEVRSTPDPLCGTGNQEPGPGGYAYGILDPGGEECLLEWAGEREYMPKRQLTQFFGKATYNGISGLRLSSSLSFSRSDRNRQEFSSFPVVDESELPVVRGELPGNPFRAVSADGRELFAVPRRDADGTIITDGYDRPVPQRGSDGNVLLATDQFSSINTDPQGGVPFYEDIQLQGWEPFGKYETNTCPQLMLDRTQAYNGRDNLCQNIRNNDERLWRATFDADFEVPFLPDWEGTAFYTYSTFVDVGREDKHMSRSSLIQGLTCDVVNDVDACFNPFAATLDSPFRTPQAVADSIFTSFRRNNEDFLQTFDTHFNGTIPLGNFELPGGAIGAAVGYQHRREQQKIRPAASVVSGDALLARQEFPRNQGREVDAWFGELALPILSNLELSASARREEFTTGQGATTSKYGVVYSPTSWLNLRGTYGDAFIVPTLNQLDSPETCGLTGVVDPYTGTQGFVVSCNSGNPNLNPESSDVVTAGFDISPIDGLTLSATWSEVDFTDRIVNTSGQLVLDLDFAQFQQATGFQASGSNPYPTLDQIRQWNNDPRSDVRITRDDATPQLIDRLDTGSSNASSVLVQSLDLELGYLWSIRDWGSFSLNLAATRTLTYDIQETLLEPVESALGNTNINTGTAPAVPKWRSNARLSWSLGPHRIGSMVRYTSSVNYDGPQFEFTAALPGSNWRQVDELGAWTELDLFYSYTDLQVPRLGGNLSFTLGARNATDREPQRVPAIYGVFAQLQNPMGRMIYGRLNYQF